MCLWLLTACLGLLPSNPISKIVVPPLSGVPAPILQPTEAPTVASTTVPTLPPTTAPTTSPATTTTVASTTNPGMVSTAIPTVVPTINPGMVSTAIPTVVPPMNPGMVSTAFPTVVPTMNPGMVSTAIPTVVPTMNPGMVSTAIPTVVPTMNPGMVSTAIPTVVPTMNPGMVSTAIPTVVPTMNPGMVSTAIPTVVPTMNPGMVSTTIPTVVPTMNPGMVSTATLTVVPTMNPGTVSTAIPTVVPTMNPGMVSTAIPTVVPTMNPGMVSTAIPTVVPTMNPGMVSTAIPTVVPTMNPGMVSTAIPTVVPTMNPGMVSPVSTTVPTTTSTMTPATTTTMTPTISSTAAAPTIATTATTIMASTMTPTMASNNITSTPAPTLIIINSGGESSPLILCNDPNIVCIINPDEIISGSIPFDPRLGTTPGTSAAYHSAVTGYSAHIPPYNDAVRFPREKRSIQDQINRKYFSRINNLNHKIIKRETCICVPSGMCTTRLPNFGVGLINIGIPTPGMQCPDSQEYCCTPNPVTPTPTPTPVPTIPCGTLQRVPTTNVTPAAGQANYGEFPWQAAIMTKQNEFIAGGVLINNLNILTVTHRVGFYLTASTLSNLKVRLGDWDGVATYEPVKIQEYNVTKFFVHENFTYSALQYDLTILRLETPVPLTPAAGAAVTINRACLPPSSTATYNGMRCMVSGWGKNMFGMAGQYQAIIKKMDVPIVPPATCQNQLRATRLGDDFVLDTISFICAGGEANKDSCTGDGGSGLVCEVNGQWVVVGLVAWGLGCASPNVPGVYVNIATLLPWIQQQIAMS